MVRVVMDDYLLTEDLGEGLRYPHTKRSVCNSPVLAQVIASLQHEVLQFGKGGRLMEKRNRCTANIAHTYGGCPPKDTVDPVQCPPRGRQIIAGTL